MDANTASALIAGSAFVLSLAAAIISAVNGRHAWRRALRSEISDTLSSINDLVLENAKMAHEFAAADPLYFQAVSGILNQQNAFLLQQAMYLMDQAPHLVTCVQWNTIAAANTNAGDFSTAEKYYRKAVDTAPNGFYRSLSCRSYGIFLFSCLRLDDGRAQFNQALAALPGSDDISHMTNGQTYSAWAMNELHIAHEPARADPLIQKAREEFMKVQNDGARASALNALRPTPSAGTPPTSMAEQALPNWPKPPTELRNIVPGGAGKGAANS